MNNKVINPDHHAAVIDYLSEYINPERRQLLESILAQRSRYLTVVLEDIYQPQNANAVVRTMECLGIQDLHVIEQRNEYQLNPGVLQGSDKWINIHRYNSSEQNNTSQCLQSLKQNGYQIAAMTLDDASEELEIFTIEQPTAFCFGTEEEGLTKVAHELADAFVKIPIYGFTQSYNVSVSSAITLYTKMAWLKSSDITWQLEQQEKDALLIQWLAQSTPSGQKLLNKFLRELDND